MRPEEKYRLRINRLVLVQTVDVKYVLNQLVATYVFDIDDDERVRAGTTSQDRAATLLNLLEKSTNQDAYREFRQALAEPYPHLVEILDKTDLSRLQRQCKTPVQESRAVLPVRRKEEGQLVRRRAPPRGGTDSTDGGPRLSSTSSASYTQNVAKVSGRGNFVIMGANQVNLNVTRH
ncbi:uncharacterized protein [Ptychodera flava]|uniref:uncharacterized protein n=1 Tax=Ptychodera flava TaxID=63121 RepID=UPI00396A8777